MTRSYGYLLLALVAMVLDQRPASAQVQQNVVMRYNGPASDTDVPSALVLDAAGNRYVTGRSVGTGSQADFATVKYNALGQELWVARYNGPANDYDSAVALAVDSLGNVYVTGPSTGVGSGADFATVKYDPNGIELWVARYNGTGGFGDNATAIALDSFGNVYVTGSSSDVVGGLDYATVKYDTDGHQLWVARYNGPGNDDDSPVGLAVDAQGQVYVTGASGGSGTGSDYATIKYDTDGHRLWVARYSGAGNRADSPAALTLDGAGNVFVTGSSQAAATGLDYATVKYDTDGHQLWVATYNGPGNYTDLPSRLALDTDGNLYVTGCSYGAQGNADFATVKYSPAGQELWVARYNGIGNRSDSAQGLALDSAGNIYVTGYSSVAVNSYDMATVKYDPAGSQLWVARFDGPADSYDSANSVKVDSLGHVLVTGVSFSLLGGADFATVEYLQLSQAVYPSIQTPPQSLHVAVGTEARLSVTASGLAPLSYQWRRNGTLIRGATDPFLVLANVQLDQASGYSVVVSNLLGVTVSAEAKLEVGFPPEFQADPSSQIALVGDNVRFEPLVSGDAPFSFQWQLHGVDLPGETASSLLITNAQLVKAGDYRVVVSNPFGLVTSAPAHLVVVPSTTQAWASPYAGQAGSHDVAVAVAVDGAGNVVVGGAEVSLLTHRDYAVVKYDPAGLELWAAHYAGPGNFDDVIKSLLVGPDGEVYVTGYSYGAGTGFDFATIKYDKDGHELWLNRFNGLGANDDFAQAMTLDNAGNVYVTGRSDGANSGADYATVKYDSRGRELWVARYDGPASSDDSAIAIAVDRHGNVYVTGYSIGIGTSSDYATVKYDAAGNQLWAVRFTGDGNNNDAAKGLALDRDGNVYVTGFSTTPGSGFDYVTVKYDTDGHELWVARYNGSANANDIPSALALDRAGNLYVTGSSAGRGSGQDYATIKYDPSGNQVWVARYNGSGNLDDSATALALDPMDSLYVTGTSGGGFATVKYDADGRPVWVNRSGRRGDAANALAVDQQRNVYVTGAMVGSSGYYEPDDFVTVKYTQEAPVEVETTLSSALLSLSGPFRLTVNGQPGRRFRIEVSSNLLDWTPVVTLLNETGVVLFDDALSGDTARLYRAVKLP